jgi:DNA-binding GntR family transcriptional regulator
MTSQTIQPHSLCIAIAGKLRERILAHQILPGSDINDGALAQEFGVSRTPVREAMKLLCQEGLLTAVPRRGMRVTQLTPAQVLEAQQLCSLLAAHLALRRSRLRSFRTSPPHSCRHSHPRSDNQNRSRSPVPRCERRHQIPKK